jgi:hypothetical protein
VINSESVSSPAPAGHRFPREVIAVAARWYLRYGLSYRDVQKLLADSDMVVDHVTAQSFETSSPDRAPHNDAPVAQPFHGTARTIRQRVIEDHRAASGAITQPQSRSLHQRSGTIRTSA